MLTLDQKVQGVEDAKLVARIVSIWTFFFSGVVPYVEGVFLPLGSVSRGKTGGLSSTNASSSGAVPSSFPASPDPSLSSRPTTSRELTSSSNNSIDVRIHLLTSFLLSILRPLLPRVIPLVSPPPSNTNSNATSPNPIPPPPTPEHLGKLQQMVLILMTQTDPEVVGKPGETGEGYQREGLEALYRAVGRAREGGGEVIGSGGGTRSSGGPEKMDRRGGWIAHRRRPTISDFQHHQSFDSTTSATPTETNNQPSMLRMPSNYSSTSESNARPSNRALHALPRHLQPSAASMSGASSTSSLFSLPAQTNNSSTSTATLTQQQPSNNLNLHTPSFAHSQYSFQSSLGGGVTPTGRGGGGNGRGQDRGEEDAYLDSLRSPELRSPGGSSGGSGGDGRRHSSPVF